MSGRPELFRLEEIDACHFALSGELGFASAQLALEQTSKIFRGASPVFFNLAGITRVDSAGLAIMLAWLREAARRETSLKFLNLPEQLLAIAHVTGVDGMLRSE